MVMSLWPRFLAHLVYAIYVSNTESLKNELTLQRRHIWQIRRKVTRRLYIHPKKSVASVQRRIAGCCRRVTLVTCTKKSFNMNVSFHTCNHFRNKCYRPSDRSIDQNVRWPGWGTDINHNYIDRTDGQTDGETPDRCFTLRTRPV